MDKNFKGRKELEKILIKLDKWNEKYNKSEDKYFTVACVDGHWLGNNNCEGLEHIDFFIDKEKMAEMREEE